MTHELMMEFPCLFTIKAIGVNQPQLLETVINIFENHQIIFNKKQDITIKPSNNGNYLSISINITAKSKTELDNIYSDLNASKLIKMTL